MAGQPRNGVSILGRKKEIFLFHREPKLAHNYVKCLTRAIFRRVNWPWHEAELSPPFSAEVKTLTGSLIGEHIDNFYL